jgi:hypothetical protein
MFKRIFCPLRNKKSGNERRNQQEWRERGNRIQKAQPLPARLTV